MTDRRFAAFTSRNGVFQPQFPLINLPVSSMIISTSFEMILSISIELTLR